MPFIVGSSRGISTNPQTPAHLRATLGKLLAISRDDAFNVEALQDLMTGLMLSFARLAIADSDIAAGQAVYSTGDESVDIAVATGLPQANVAGVAIDDVVATGVVTYIPFGVVVREGWGLTPGQVYYLSALNPGEIVAVPDSDDQGDFVVEVGKAIMAEVLFLNVQSSVLL
jgi:hypothetical protein